MQKDKTTMTTTKNLSVLGDILFSLSQDRFSKNLYHPAYYASMLILKYIYSVIMGQTVRVPEPERNLRKEIQEEESEIESTI